MSEVSRRRQDIWIGMLTALLALCWAYVNYKRPDFATSLTPAAPYYLYHYRPLSKVSEERAQDLYRRYQYNSFLSDLLPVNRETPDSAKPLECYGRLRRPITPFYKSVSVIIVYRNEAESVVLRSVHSILRTTSPALLRDIILVDDGSYANETVGQDVFAERFYRLAPPNSILSLLRQPRRGLASARTLGVAASRGEVLVFLDAHVECAPDWIEPLLEEISQHPDTVACPRIPVIHHETFEFEPYNNVTDNQHGAFDWTLTYIWQQAPEAYLAVRRMDRTGAIPSAALAGGLFAIRKEFFLKLGGYDPEFEFWGGDNIELSLKTWMCGGRIVICPCSVVGHVYRLETPHRHNESMTVLLKNLARVASVWIDEPGRQRFYLAHPNALREPYLGPNLDKRKALREELRCHNTEWYVRYVNPNLYWSPAPPLFQGQIYSPTKTQCIDTLDEQGYRPPILYICHLYGLNQYFEYTVRQELRNAGRAVELCLTVIDYSNDTSATIPEDKSHRQQELIWMKPCTYTSPNTRVHGRQRWLYDDHRGIIMSVFYRLCLSIVDGNLTLDVCEKTVVRWTIV